MKNLEQKITASWDLFIINNENNLNNEKTCEDIPLLTQNEDSLLEERFNFEDYFENSCSLLSKKQIATEGSLQNKEELLHFLKEFKIQKEVFGRILFKEELQRIDAEMLD